MAERHDEANRLMAVQLERDEWRDLAQAMARFIASTASGLDAAMTGARLLRRFDELENDGVDPDAHS